MTTKSINSKTLDTSTIHGFKTDESQNEFLSRIGFLINPILPKLHKYIIDVGANDGITQSNSFNFINDLGWYGTLIEPQNMMHLIYANHANNASKVQVATVGIYTETIPALLEYDKGGSNLMSTVVVGGINQNKITTPALLLTFEDFLKRYNIPHDIGIISIDTEGLDYYVIQSMLKTWIRPQVVISENFTNDELNNFKRNLLIKNDYRLVFEDDPKLTSNEVYFHKNL